VVDTVRDMVRARVAEEQRLEAAKKAEEASEKKRQIFLERCRKIFEQRKDDSEGTDTDDELPDIPQPL